MKLALASLGVIAATLAHAETPATVRVGSHPGFGRVVFDLPNAAPFQLSERGSRIVVTFSGGGTIGMPDAVPRNVVSILGGEGSATLTVAPGARIRSAQMGSRVVIDILDPIVRSRPATPAPAASGPPQPAAAPAVASEPAASTTTPPASAAQPAEPPASAPPPSEPVLEKAPVEEVKVALPVAEPAPASPAPVLAPLHVAAPANVGVAAFRRGDRGVVVFDDRVAIDAGQLERAGLVEARVKEAGKATTLVIPLAAEAALEVARDQAGWTVQVSKAQVAAAEQKPVADGIAFSFANPGHVLTIRDPFTGQTLLIGTSKAGGAAGRSVTETRRAPGYVLLPTWLGLAIEPSADQVTLRASLSGFTLVTPDADSPAKTASAAPESRFGVPNAPRQALTRQLQAEIVAAAALPPRARGRDRVAAARTMLALGMATEAQALLTLAAEEDPAVAADPAAAVLSGMAAVLAGRPEEATGLDAPGTEANDEVLLWRGLRDAAEGKPADSVGRAVSVAMLYPKAIRDRILPPVVEAAVRDGQSPLADTGLAKQPGLTYAKALQAERDGKIDEALSSYDALDRGRDLSDSVRAAISAAELRLAKGKITPAEAAEVLDRQTVRWRGDGRELATRLRVAELRIQADQWRPALDALKETENLFPNAKAEIGLRKGSVFKALVADGKANVSPLDMVALTGDYADCIPDGPDGEAIAALLADKLIALDLPSRAIPVLQRLLAGAKSERAKAPFALALAQLHLELDEPAKAESVLKSVDGADLPSEKAETRSLLLARARAAQGDNRAAADLLSSLASPAADELRARLAAQSGDWQGNLRALNDLAAKLVPTKGELNEQQQDVVLRQAVAAVQAGDSDALDRLRPLDKRMTGARADQFRLLTTTAVRSIDDLPRAAGELALSRSFSARAELPKPP